MLCFVLLLRQTFQNQIDAKVRFDEDAQILERLMKEEDDERIFVSSYKIRF